MLDIKNFEQGLQKVLDIGEKYQATAEFQMEFSRDVYEVPPGADSDGSKKRELVEGGMEVIVILKVPAGPLPPGATLVPRVNMEERIRNLREGFNLIGQEEE